MLVIDNALRLIYDAKQEVHSLPPNDTYVVLVLSLEKQWFLISRAFSAQRKLVDIPTDLTNSSIIYNYKNLSDFFILFSHIVRDPAARDTAKIANDYPRRHSRVLQLSTGFVRFSYYVVYTHSS